MAASTTDNSSFLRYRRNVLISRLNSCSAVIKEEMDEDYYTPDSVPAVDNMLLEEALERSDHPAEYLSTMLPSRQLYRSGLGLSPSYHQTVYLERKRASSSCRRSGQSVVHTDSSDGLEEDGVQTSRSKESSLLDSINLLKRVHRSERGSEDCDDPKFYKCLRCPMAEKREVRDSLTRSRELIDNRYRRSNWKSKMSRNYYSFRESIGSSFSNIHFWANSIHNIEGQYGTAVAAVFFFIQWLMSVNLMIMVLVISFIVIPNSVISDSTLPNNSSEKSRPVASITCNYTETADEEDMEFGSFQDFLQGTGWMEFTAMFYGFYLYNFTNETSPIDVWYESKSVTYDSTQELPYNLPLAYIIVTVVYFSFCLFLILKSAAKDSREILFSATAKINEGCNLVFCGWDFCIVDDKKAVVRKEIISNEIANILDEEKLWEERLQRTKRQNIRLIFIRIFINIIVMLILAFCGYIIFAVVSGCQLALNVYQKTGKSMIIFIAEFLPPFTITVLNLIVPVIFERLVKFEHYSPASVTNMTLGRSVVLKLAGILVLLTSLYKSIAKNTSCRYHCWETYVGQQIYKLTIMDFVSIIFITFFIQYPRKLFVERLQWGFVQWIGQQPFDIPSQVLDIVYSQTLSWMGTFFSPLLSVVNVIKMFILFYVKRFSLFTNCAPARLTYRASKSNKLFMMILLVSYIIAILPVFYSIVEITPSVDCGPFIGYKSMWSIVPETMENWPTLIRSIVNSFTTAGFILPTIVCLSLIIYFYTTVASAHNHEKELMQDQLLVEGQDKQFLLKMLHKVMEELANPI